MSATLKSRIEAVLFVAANPMSIREIAQILNQEEVDIEEALLNLMFDYQSSDGALEIDDENGYILQVKKEHLDIVEKLCPVELRGAVLKTLSVIALKEPIRLTYLKELRGADSYNHVNELVEKVKEIGCFPDFKNMILFVRHRFQNLLKCNINFNRKS